MLRSNKLSNSVKVLHLLTNRLKVPVSIYTVERELVQHPNYPSLLALSDCLTLWNIPNEAVKVSFEGKMLEEFPVPFIAFVNRNGGQFLVVEEMNDTTIVFSDETSSRQSFSREEFVKLSDGTLLYAEKDSTSGEANYLQSLMKGWLNTVRNQFIIIIAMLAIGYKLSLNYSDLFYLILFALTTVGVAVSTLLLLHSIDINNPFVKNICGQGKKSDCNAILNSSAANLTSWLSWSEVGMFYFSGCLLFLLINPTYLSLLFWLNIVCLPYAFYSIGYQMKQKKWCILCCSVQIIIWLQAFTFYFSGTSFKTNFTDVNGILIISALLCFLIPISIWSFLKPFFVKATSILPLNEQLNAFKNDSSLFHQKISAQTKYLIPDEIMPIVMGNPDAQTIITMVSNPFCDPCAKAHKKLHDWLGRRDDITLKILFSTVGHRDDAHSKVARHALALSMQPDYFQVRDALNDWYSQTNKNYESWARIYPTDITGEIDTISKRQNDWCQMAEISFTPTIFINGYKLTTPYQIDDLKYLLA